MVLGFEWLRKRLAWKSESFRRREIIQPPKVDDSQKELANWITRQIRRLDNDRWHLLNALEEKNARLNENYSKEIDRLNTEIRTLSRTRSAEKSIASLMYKPEGEENPSLIAPLEGVFNKLAQKVVDMKLAAENKKIMRMSISTLVGVVFIVGVGLGGLYLLNKTTSYDQNLSTIKRKVENYTEKVDKQQKQYSAFSNSFSNAISNLSSNLDYKTKSLESRTYEEVTSFKNMVRESNGKMNRRIDAAEREMYNLTDNVLPISLAIDELKENQNELEDSLAIYASGLASNRAEYQAFNEGERARMERTIQDFSNQLFKLEERHSAKEEKMLRQLNEISAKYQKLEERVNKKDNQATNAYEE